MVLEDRSRTRVVIGLMGASSVWYTQFKMCIEWPDKDIQMISGMFFKMLVDRFTWFISFGADVLLSGYMCSFFHCCSASGEK